MPAQHSGDNNDLGVIFERHSTLYTTRTYNNDNFIIIDDDIFKGPTSTSLAKEATTPSSSNNNHYYSLWSQTTCSVQSRSR